MNGLVESVLVQENQYHSHENHNTHQYQRIGSSLPNFGARVIRLFMEWRVHSTIR